jgi:hypothetical protein
MLSSKLFVFEVHQLDTTMFLEEEDAVGFMTPWWLN